ncbi:bifunctional 5,10-methylenetetrahydrofolate dehydrogenase/5,10-methenyltetrahydrofolate cyclohydrolase [Candidatus Kaiserbacteria bacterium]|nr:bifunctional 5,10-methylenetetrahydrofolate dehydrogenase/5,10-methenyltetrahydrofolate cyclohydrolase [Candidatus Kaiserbacteria bacterium]
MIVDGVRIARLIDAEVLKLIQKNGEIPRLRIFACQPTFATQRFLALKKARAEKLGVALEVKAYPPNSTTDEIVAGIKTAVAEADGSIVQLPFPPHTDMEQVLAAIPASHDVDAIGAEAEKLFADGKPLVLPPVVGAIAEIIARHNVEVRGKRVVVVGEGRLVGAPAAVWFRQQGADVRTVNRKTEGLARFAREADILVLGAGVPGLITPDMVRDGVVIFDAGSSEDAGKLVGDADPACAERAALFTPVPGGIGPITVALIFRNLLALVSIREKGGA